MKAAHESVIELVRIGAGAPAGPAGTGPAAEPRAAERVARERNKLSKRLHRLVGQAIADFEMIGAGDRVMVCLSGGKDSYGLLDILLSLRERAPVAFEIVAVNLDQKQPGFPADVLPGYLESRGIPFRIETQDTYSIVRRNIPEGKTMCSLCSRLRRGILYRVADEIGATRIALGHHRDDILATFFLNLFHGGKLKSMPPKLVSDDGRHVVIRPLAYVEEADLVAYAEWKQFPIIPCTLCGSQENLQRQEIGKMLRDWQRRHPGRVENMFAALSRVVPSHLMDRGLFDFAGLAPTGVPDPDGDRAFDADEPFAHAEPTEQPDGQPDDQPDPLPAGPGTPGDPHHPAGPDVPADPPHPPQPGDPQQPKPQPGDRPGPAGPVEPPLPIGPSDPPATPTPVDPPMPVPARA